MAELQLATFDVDVTCPLGHRLMGLLPVRATEVVDPLFARGFVLLGAGRPIVLVAVDWCELRNEAYERWRDAIAAAAGTTSERVLVSCLHQHDAPVADLAAENLLAKCGLPGGMLDYAFHEQTVERVAAAVREAAQRPRRITALGTGQARVEKIASNRRVVHPDGRVSFSRGSRSAGEAFYRDAPDGQIDPFVKALTFFDGDEAVVRLYAYATHPMSYYGQGGVSADFVGLARTRRQQDEPGVQHVYVSGCSGDITAGKYNDGAPLNRAILAERLHAGMTAAAGATERHRLDEIRFRVARLDLEFRREDRYTAAALTQVLEDADQPEAERILAAMGLASRKRRAAGHAIDVPCVDLGPARIVLLPGESFVGYQLLAQELCAEAFVVSIGYGECWPGYIPTEAAFEDGFDDKWLWVAPGSEARVRQALSEALS
ncbi:MAG TPA: hypothetical protein VML55_20450 [Planctomycetaceae bacterium]|nr:hypothetical protein [Planctomycetaceae bacterium]